MNILKKIQEYAAFTKNEQKMFLLLSVVFLAGAGIKLYKTYGVSPSPKEFDYSASDSAFAQHSMLLATKENPSTAVKKPNSTAVSFHTVINLNAASKEELDKLPGVGKGIAEQIIRYRTEHGKFKRVDELKNIKGIGERKFKTLQQFVSIK